MQPASAQATISEVAAAMPTLRPRAIGPGEAFRLQLSSRIGMRFGYFERAACRRSQVPSLEPPSTMITSFGGGICSAKLETSPSMSSASLRTVAVTLTGAVCKRSISSAECWVAVINVPIIEGAENSVAECVRSSPDLYQIGDVLELATGGIYIAAARAPDKGGNSCPCEEGLERQHTLVGRCGKGNFRPGIEGDQIDFGPEATDQINDLARLPDIIIDIAQQDIFEGEPLAGAQREVAQGCHQLGQGPLFGDGHDAGAQQLIRSVEGDREFGAHRLGAKVGQAGHDAGGGDGHTRFWDADAFHQQPHGLHEIVVVEKRLALAHKDQVQAIARERNLLIVENSQDLPHDLAGG